MLVPMQDFSRTWTDEDLYQKYKLGQSEMELIDSMIKPMSDSATEDSKICGVDGGEDTHTA